MKGKPLRLRLFLEGIEVPVIAAVCSGGKGMPASASIQIVPTDAVSGFLPRTLVHLFYREDRDQTYHLLFAGEVIGFDLVRSDMQKNAVLKCLDFSSYWDAAKMYFLSEYSDTTAKETGYGINTKKIVFSGATKYVYDETGASPATTIIKMLTDKSKMHPDVAGLLGGLLRLLEFMGGINYKGDVSKGINDFFTQAELRLKLTRMLGAASDDTSKALLDTYGFRPMLRNVIAARGKYVSFRDILATALARIQHDYSSMLCPYYTSPSEADVIVKTTTKIVNKKLNSTLSAFHKRAAIWKAVLESFKSTSRTVSNTADTSGFDTVPAADLQKLINNLRANYTILVSDQAFSKFAKDVNDNRSTTDKNIVGLVGIDNTCILTLGTIITPRDDAPGKYKISITLVDKLKKSISSLLAAYGAGVTYKTETDTKKLDTSDRLYTQIFAPELIIAAPPKSNVLFPEHISSYTISRSWLEETTRLLLTSRKEQKDLDDYVMEGRKLYLAPAIEDTSKTKTATKLQKAEAVIYSHELFSGINAKFEEMPNIPAYDTLTKKTDALDTAEGTSGDKIAYMQRMANFLFIKSRLAARTMQVTGRFNPSAIPGMPLLAIPEVPLAYQQSGEWKTLIEYRDAKINGENKLSAVYRFREIAEINQMLSTIRDELKELTELAKLQPTAYIGVLHNLTHSINQGGGTTAYSITHVWLPGKEDIPAVTSAKYKVYGKAQEKTTRFLVNLSGIFLKREGSGGYKVSPVGYLTEMTDAAFNNNLCSSESGPPLVGWFSNRKDAQNQAMKITSSADGSYFRGPNGGRITKLVFEKVPPSFLVDVSNPNRYTIASTDAQASVVITEMVSPSKELETKLPFEYAVRPPWLGTAFLNEYIGKEFYEKLFGCPSICDVYQTRPIFTYTPMNFHPEDAALSCFISDIAKSKTITDAVNNVIREYLAIKATGIPQAVVDFTEVFTSRPVATTTDVLGTPDVKFNPDGTVTDGTAGFHSRAFGEYENFKFLVRPTTTISNGAPEQIAVAIKPDLDPRKPRRLAIDNYQLELNKLGKVALSSFRTYDEQR